jgi:hypothetical protein
MRAKIGQNANGETTVNYARVHNIQNFRYSLLKKILASSNRDITLLIDTNQRIDEKPFEQIESVLQQLQIHYFSTLTETNSKQFFGITMPKNRKKPFREYKIVMELPDNIFSRELFESIKGYDFSIGFGKNKSFEAICEDYKTDNFLVVFNTEIFQDSIYDSIVCEGLRSTINVEQFVGIAENETSI